MPKIIPHGYVIIANFEERLHFDVSCTGLAGAACYIVARECGLGRGDYTPCKYCAIRAKNSGDGLMSLASECRQLGAVAWPFLNAVLAPRRNATLCQRVGRARSQGENADCIVLEAHWFEPVGSWCESKLKPRTQNCLCHPGICRGSGHGSATQQMTRLAAEGQMA